MTEIINQDVLFFFDGRPEALALYECFAREMARRFPDAEIRVQKTQIGFYERHLLVCVSLTPVKRKADRPEHFITVTFGLDHPLEDPRAVVVPIRPNRFTHHVIVGRAEEIDEELMGWIGASHRD